MQLWSPQKNAWPDLQVPQRLTDMPSRDVSGFRGETLGQWCGLGHVPALSKAPFSLLYNGRWLLPPASKPRQEEGPLTPPEGCLTQQDPTRISWRFWDRLVE